MKTQQDKKPYDLTTMLPDDLDALLLKRPDLRKEIFAEADRRELQNAQTALENEGGR